MIRTQHEYKAIIERMEVLLQDSENIENMESEGYIELNLLSDLVADYEESNYPLVNPDSF